MNGNVTYRQQYTRCGKQRCRKCQEGTGHGPYWYAYWRENGRTISKYLGIHAPAEATRQKQQIISTPEEKIVQLPGAIEATALGHPLVLQGGTGEMHAGVERQVQANVAPMPANVQTIPSHLRIYLLGQFRVERKKGHIWQRVADPAWRRRRARALLGCLLSQAGRCMGREQVMEALWPEADVEAAANRLNGAVHELRQILEPEIARPAASNLLRLEHDLLILADASQIWVDAEIFEELLKSANMATDPVQAERLLEEAAALYEGDYLLEELYSEWATSRRESLRRGWVGLLLNLAELRIARGVLVSAIEPLDRLLMTDPTNETAVRRLMLLLTQLDRRGEAMRTYQRLVSLLKRDYGSDPLPETVELYKSLRQGQINASRHGTEVLSMASLDRPLVERKKENKSLPQAQEENDAPDPPIPELGAVAPLALLQNLPLPRLPHRRPNQSPFVGRKYELETLHQALLAIDNISPRSKEKGEKWERLSSLVRFVTIRGEVGIGKTRLAEELSYEAQARGWTVAWTRAYEQEGTIPYRPWTNILRSLLHDISQHQLINLLEGKTGWATGSGPGALISTAAAQALLTRLSVLLPELATHYELHLSQDRARPPAISERDRFLLWEAVLSLLSTLSQSTPLLLILDDLHWTDGSSLELLTYLVRHLQHERILLVGTYRDTELATDASLRLHLNDLHRERMLQAISLQPLTHAQIGSLIGYLPPELVRSIQSQASGNPLFAEELARFSAQNPCESSNKEHPGSGHLSGSFDEIGTAINRFTPLPDTIAAVLERRLNKLSPACQTLLSKAAVLGGSFEFDLLLRMTGNVQAQEDATHATLDLLEEALRSGFISEEASGPGIVYHFWHPLIVSHLYEHISVARRALLHRRVAHALIELHANNEAEVAAAIAYHLGKYGQEKHYLIYYSELAGNQAMALSAYPEALYHYHQALYALYELNATVPTQKQDTLHLADLLECLAECNTMLGNYPEARQQYIQALELHNLQQVDASSFADPEAFLLWQQEKAQVQGIIWRFLGRIWEVIGDYSQAHTCVLRGKEILRGAGITDGVAWACLEHLDGAIYSDEGNFAEARRHVEASLAIHEEALRKIQVREHKEGGPGPNENLHLPLLMTRSRRLLQGNPLDLGLVREALGVIYSGMGLYSEALQHLYVALLVYEEHDLVGAMGQCYSNIGAVHTMRAEYEIAKDYFQRAMAVTERTGDLPSKALITGNLGDIAWRCGDLQEAENWLIESLVLTEQITDRDGTCWCLVTLGIVQRDLGNMRGALEKIRRALDLARSMNNTVRMGFALAVLADWLISLALIRANRKTTGQTKIVARAGESRLLHIAVSLAEQALALEGIDSETQGIGQEALAHIHLLLGNVNMALQLALKTLEEARQNEAIYLIGRLQRLLGQIQTAQGFKQEAERYFKQALQLFKQYGLRLEYTRTLELQRLVF